MRKNFFLIVISWAILSGCAGDDSSSSLAVERWQGELPVAQPWLRDQLPEGILAYHRIPHPVGLLATPKGNVFDTALASDANVRNILSIQQGLSENILQALPLFGDARLRFALERIRSPIEIAAFGPPTPSALTAMTLDVGSAADFEGLIRALAGVQPSLSLAAPLDNSGFAQLEGLPAPTFLKFDVGSGQLLMQTGANVTAASFAQTVSSLQPGSAHAMHGVETLIDESEQGWFAWLDTETTLPMARLFLPIEITQRIESVGLDGTRSVAFGGGVAKGKGRLSFILDIGLNRHRRFLPLVQNKMNATAVGEPDGLVLFSIPTPDEFGRIESLVLEKLSPAEKQEWTDAKASLLKKTGASLEEIFSAIGPEFLLILDAAGDYFGLRLRDADLFDDIVRRLGKRAGVEPAVQQAYGVTFYHWDGPSIYSAIDPDELDRAADLGVLLQRQREHWHWMREGDFVYFSSIPQPLMDRRRMGADTDVSAWLAESQGVDMSSSVFAATGSVAKVPRRLYHVYVEMMQFIADLAKADYDVWAMPTAGQLGLPDRGALGFTANFGEPYVSMEFTFESNPAEFLSGAGFGSVAIVGVLAAIAIPAYQDYTTRVRIAAGLSAATGAQAAVAEHYVTKGRFPGEATAPELSRYDTGEYVRFITVEPDTGLIVIEYSEDAVPGGGQVYLEPSLTDNDEIIWACSGSVADRYLPSACHDNPLPTPREAA